MVHATRQREIGRLSFAWRHRGQGIAAAVLGCGLFAGSAQGNLLQNPGFNDSTDASGSSQPVDWTGWSYGDTGYASYVGDGTSAQNEDGTPFVGVGNYGDWWTSAGGWYQVVAGAAGQTYSATIDSATEDWDNAYGSLQLIYLDDADNILRTDIVNVANYEAAKPWTTYTLDGLDPAPDGTTRVKFEVLSNGARGTVLYDNAVLTAVPEPASLGLVLAGAGMMLGRRRRAVA